jgi:structural maintenance of chromosome 2
MDSIVREVETLEQNHTKTKDLHANLTAEMDRERARITDFDEELQSLDTILRQKNTTCSEGTLTLQKLRHEVEKYNKEEQTSAAAVTQLETEYDWIADSKDDFGKRGTPYDFHGQNMSECKSALRQLSERFQSMKRKVNPKVMGMIDSVEKKETALKNMVRTVIKDKAKIEETIVSLDEYKKEALHRTWEKVNGYVALSALTIVTLDRFSGNCCLGILPSWSRLRGNRSLTDWRLKFVLGRCGNRV